MADDLSRSTTRACPSRYTCAGVDIIRMDDADRADLFLNRIGAAVFDFIRLIRVVYGAIPVIGRCRVVVDPGDPALSGGNFLKQRLGRLKTAL